MPDIPPQDWTDRENVEAWLRGQPREISILIGVRSILRILPLRRRRDRWDINQEHVLLWFGGCAAAWTFVADPEGEFEADLSAVAFGLSANAVLFEDAAASVAASVSSQDPESHICDALDSVIEIIHQNTTLLTAEYILKEWNSSIVDDTKDISTGVAIDFFCVHHCGGLKFLTGHQRFGAC